jgi:hypothetical protein
MNGSCGKGSHCTFSHDWKHQPDMVCRYYLEGQCWYGDKCRYDHVRPKYKMPDKELDDAKPKKLGSSLGPVLLPSQSAGPPSSSTTTGALPPKVGRFTLCQMLLISHEDCGGTYPTPWTKAHTHTGTGSKCYIQGYSY